jgi:XRE family transcriptional regulator, regulator of sulfur utilization
VDNRQAEKIVRAVAARLRERRETMGLSMNAVAKAAGLDQRAISRIEKGEFSPTLRALVKMASVLKVKLNAILRELE